MKTQLILNSLSCIMAEIESIKKTRENKEQRYKFRGIEDVYKALHPLMVKNKVVMKIETLNSDVVQFNTARGTLMFKQSVEVAYTFLSVEDGSEFRCVMRGEAMDSGDKATGKAYSTAFKSLAFQMFCIPVDDGTDIENESPEVVSGNSAAPNVDEAQEWLNMRTKQGALTNKGTAAINFIKEGGSLDAIKRKYKLNKAEVEELTNVVAERDEYLKANGLTLNQDETFTNG